VGRISRLQKDYEKILLSRDQSVPTLSPEAKLLLMKIKVLGTGWREIFEIKDIGKRDAYYRDRKSFIGSLVVFYTVTLHPDGSVAGLVSIIQDPKGSNLGSKGAYIYFKEVFIEPHTEE